MSEPHEPPLVTRSYSVLTPRGRSAVAVVQVRADAELFERAPARFIAANGRPLSAQPVNRVCYGRWGSATGEDVVVCRIAPDVTEVSCHGGASAVTRIINDLQACGCRPVHWHEVGKAGSVGAECRQALTSAPTLRTAAILLEQSAGLLEQACKALLASPQGEWTERLDDILRWAEFGVHLTQPWQVALIGLPNVGKSSLMNALLGYGRSIVYSEPGTTRDIVTAVTAFDGWPIELSDTAGLRDAPEAIESEGVNRARRQAAAADLPIVVLDRSRPLNDDDRRLAAATSRSLLVANKMDLPDAWSDHGPPETIQVSSMTGAGVEQLVRTIASTLVPAVPVPGTAIPITHRQVGVLSAAYSAVISGAFEEAARNLRSLGEFDREVRIASLSGTAGSRQ